MSVPWGRSERTGKTENIEIGGECTMGQIRKNRETENIEIGGECTMGQIRKNRENREHRDRR